MKKQFKALLLAGFLCVLMGGAASAQSWCNGTGTWYYYYDGSYSPYYNNTCHGWTSTGSGHVFGVKMYWNSAGRTGVQNYVSSGKRYTHDITDLNNNLSATGTCLHLVPKSDARFLQRLDERRKVLDLQDDAVPAAGFLWLTVGHGSGT